MELGPAVVVEDLYKFYGDFPAVRGASFTVPRGGVFGLLGPNGAGKTTTIKSIVGLIRPSRGRIRVMGHPAGSIEAKRLIGYAPERFSIGGGQRLLDFLVYIGVIYGLKRREAEEKALELLEWVGLSGWEHEMFSELSAGMKRRLGLAQALMGNPEILVLDEPTEHLDALGRMELLNKISELAASGRTVILSTHVLAEAEMIVDSFAIMYEGRVVFQGSLGDSSSRSMARIEVDNPILLSSLLEKRGIRHYLAGKTITVESAEVGEEALKICLEAGIKVRRYEVGRIGLSELFMKLVGGGGSE